MKQESLIRKMTLEEKAAFLSGSSEWQSRALTRLGIPCIFLSDGPHGIRKQEGPGDHLGLHASAPATCFPPAATVANSWDERLGEEIGAALGEEAAVLGVDVLLGPGLNIKRSPLCGRNFEYFSEDPYLSGKMAASYIRGIQSKGIFACPKHFAVNSQEQRRMAMNAVIDERTLREIYLTGFEIAVKEGGAKAVMTSYNEINGVYANENRQLLQNILRDEWNFDGIVVTDWGASNDHVQGVACRSNLEMPSPGLDSAREIIDAVQNGRLTMAALDTCVDDLLDAVLTMNRTKKSTRKIDPESHHHLAEKAAAESIVLLKNDQNLLPLKKNCRVALIGDFARVPRYQGAGSSLVNPACLHSMEQAIQQYPVDFLGYEPGYRRDGRPDDSKKKAAVALAEKSDVVLYCFGLTEQNESEGTDRTHMRIPENQTELLEALSMANPNIIGIISAGSAIEMPWHIYCRSIVHGYLGGQAGADAMMKVLTGKKNPSGRLNETYPLRYEDTPAYHYFPAAQRNSEYRESIYTGYRYYDTNRINVQYPFGYGLSYTEFTYSDLMIHTDYAEFTIANSGNCDGTEIAQMYISGPKGQIFRPDKELKGFRKLFLKKGEQIRVAIPFHEMTFRYWNVKTGNWETEPGNYTIFIGASVMDIRLTEHIYIKGTVSQSPYDTSKMASYYSACIRHVPDIEFEQLLGHPIPDGSWSGALGRNDAICQMYYAKSRLARLIYRLLSKAKTNRERKGNPDLNILFIYNMPFRAIAKMTHGAVSMHMVDGIVEIVNGHFLKGLLMTIKYYFINRKGNREYEKKLNTVETDSIIP